MKKFFFALLLFTVSFAIDAHGQKQYTNPILAGFYPDPSICRVGDDYYLVNSTFAYFPGIPVFHSKDLVNWKLIGHVMSRPEQMNLSGKGVSRAIFAPTIRYHKGLFYVTCTLIDDKGNFVATAKNPAGPWSNPYWLHVDGIDPSLFFDEDDKAYLVYNSIPPGNKSLYDGHRTIRINEFDYKNMKVVGDNKILVNGGSDLSKKPSWIEGPHLLKKYGYYYLVAAEGGTGFDHSEVAFRSKTLDKPFVPYENNPILTQRKADRRRKYPVTSTGHADLVELPNGDWQAVFLGTRPYEEEYFNTGRETFLAPVTWNNEWPIINPGLDEVQYFYPQPFPGKTAAGNSTRYSGNFSYKENFSGSQLSNDWIFLRTPTQKWFSLSNKKGFFSMQLRPETAAGKMNPSFIARRQQHMKYTASASLLFKPLTEKEKAGVALFINEDHFYYLCLSKEKEHNAVQLYQSNQNRADSNSMLLLLSQSLPPNTTALQFKVEANKDKYAFYFSYGSGHWQLLKENVDARFLSTKSAGGFGSNFVGSTIALYATSMGSASKSTAYFDWFEYKGDDEIYRK